jgi:hypothetical protein
MLLGGSELIAAMAEVFCRHCIGGAILATPTTWGSVNDLLLCPAWSPVVSLSCVLCFAERRSTFCHTHKRKPTWLDVELL